MSSNLTNGWADNIPSPEEAALANAPDVYYDAARKDYWIENNRGGWITINETAVRRYLRAAGITSFALPGELSLCDEKLIQIQTECDVAFAGPLAGYPVGIREMLGSRILVTTAPKLIEPVQGYWPTLEKLLENLLRDPGYDQRPHLYGWLKIAVEAIRSAEFRPGQVLVMAGERDCGKSLLQNIITEILGGRSAKPYRYMSGGTNFNSELCGAEHLMVEDDIASTDIRTRREFGARFKDFTVNEVQSYHAKNRPAVSLKPIWRVSVSLNDEPENLMILPPLDESLKDKIMLLKAHRKLMPMPTGTMAERAAFRQKLTSELPPFLWFLNEWVIPGGLRSERFGIIHYHHPELLSAIESLAPETRLLEMIDEYFWARPTDDPRIKAKPAGEIEVTAAELQRELFESPLQGEARKLLSWSNATGTYLGRLAQKRSDRVKAHRDATNRRWTITPPPGGMTP